MPVIKNTQDEVVDPPAGSKVLTEDELKNFMSDVKDVLTPAKVEQPKKVVTVELDVDVQDKRDYIRTLLAGECFTKEYKLFGDNVSVVFKTRTVAENATIRKLTSDAYSYNKSAIKISMVSMQKKGEPKHTDVDFDNMDDLLYAAIVRAFRKFEELSDTLFKKADDPNFWQGTGGLA